MCAWLQRDFDVLPISTFLQGAPPAAPESLAYPTPDKLFFLGSTLPAAKDAPFQHVSCMIPNMPHPSSFPGSFSVASAAPFPFFRGGSPPLPRIPSPPVSRAMTS